MGTSSSYGGPSGNNPLIPSWADENELSGDVIPNQQNTKNPNSENISDQPVINPVSTVRWQNVKSSFTRFSNTSVPSNWRVRNTLRTFTKAQGGSKNSANISRQGRKVAQNIGNVFSGFLQQGSQLVYEGINFKDYIGKKTSDLLPILIDLVCPKNNDIESSIAKEAAINTFQDIFELFEIDLKGLDNLKNLQQEDVMQIFEIYVGNYIYTSLLNKVGKQLLKLTPKEAPKREKWVKDYIFSKVKHKLSKIDIAKVNWKNVEGQKVTSKIFQEAYDLLQT